MEEPRGNSRRPSNQSGVYEQPYGSDGIYNEYFDPLNDGKSTKLKKEISVRINYIYKILFVFKCLDISKSKIFWLVILLVVIITGVVSGLIVFYAFEKKVIFWYTPRRIAETSLYLKFLY